MGVNFFKRKFTFVYKCRELWKCLCDKSATKVEKCSHALGKSGMSECSAGVEKFISVIFQRFRWDFIRRWKHCLRNQNFFSTNIFISWIKTSISQKRTYESLTLPRNKEPVLSTSLSKGRHENFFGEFSDWMILKRIQLLIGNHPTEGAVFAERQFLHFSGERDAAELLKGTANCSVYGTWPEAKITLMSPVSHELLSIMYAIELYQLLTRLAEGLQGLRTTPTSSNYPSLPMRTMSLSLWLRRLSRGR